MPQTPRLIDKDSSQTTRQQLSALMVLFVTAIDTTWRAFVPTLGGVFAGIGLDAWLGIAPFGVVGCLVLGVILSTTLIIRQLINVRKPM